MTCNDYSIVPINDEPEYDAAQVAAAIDAVETHYEGLMSHAVPAGEGRLAAILFSNPAGDLSKFYGPQTHLVLEAARLWHDHLKGEQAAFTFAAALDPATFETVDVVEDEVPADVAACE